MRRELQQGTTTTLRAAVGILVCSLSRATASPDAVQHLNSTPTAEVNEPPKAELPSKSEPPLCLRSFALPRARPLCEFYAGVSFSAGGGGGGKSAGKSKRWGKSAEKGQGWRRGSDDSDADEDDGDDGGKLYIKVCVLY